jgi:hypothetical protein
MKTLRKNDPKEYWKILNTGKSTKQPDIEFKELLDIIFSFVLIFGNFVAQICNLN